MRLRLLLFYLLSTISAHAGLWVAVEEGGYYLLEDTQLYYVNPSKSSINQSGWFDEVKSNKFSKADRLMVIQGKIYLMDHGRAFVYDPEHNLEWIIDAPPLDKEARFISSGSHVFLRIKENHEIKVVLNQNDGRPWYSEVEQGEWKILYWLFGLLIIGVFGFYSFRYKRSKKIQSVDPLEIFYKSLDTREHTLLKELIKTSIRGQAITTDALIELLDLGTKSSENQRKWRNLVIKALNDKAFTHLGLNSVVDRQRNPDDQREVWYILSPTAIDVFRDSFSFNESPRIRSYS